MSEVQGVLDSTVDADYQTVVARHDTFMAVMQEKASGGGLRERRAAARLQRNGFLARHASGRAYERYLAEDGEAGNWQGFFEWLVANWQTILKMILDIVGLFGAAAAPLAETLAAFPMHAAATAPAPRPAAAVKFPAIDVELVGKVASKLDEFRRVAQELLELGVTSIGTIPGLGGLFGG